MEREREVRDEFRAGDEEEEQDDAVNTSARSASRSLDEWSFGHEAQIQRCAKGAGAGRPEGEGEST